MSGLFQKFFSILKGGRSPAERMLQNFHDEQQHLQEVFFAAAASSDKPRGLRWKSCDWLSTYALVEDRSSGLLTLFCGVNVSFEAIEGGDMEGVEAVSMIRDGSAVFHGQDGRWGTGGRVLFNMTPGTAATSVTPGQTLRSADDGLAD